MQNKIKSFKKGQEIAPWISNMLTLFENDESINLHVISPHEWIPYYKKYIDKKITYHFINQGIPFLGKNWPRFFPFDLWVDYYFLKVRVKQIISKINPDIIHLHGAENTFHPATIFQFQKKIPVFITLQGFLHIISPNDPNPRIRRRIKREISIYKSFFHFGYRTETMKEVIMKINPKANFHFHQYPYFLKPITLPTDKKEFDIVFFARISVEKGILDLLNAIIIIKPLFPKIQLAIIGNSDNSFLENLKSFCKSKDIESNVNWFGFLPTQSDVHRIVSNAKITVLPTHYDMIPGTIIESMFLKIPVISYCTGSIPELNKEDKVIELVKKGNIEKLADRITFLLQNDKYRDRLAEKAYNKAITLFDQRSVKNDILNTYKSILSYKRLIKNHEQ